MSDNKCQHCGAGINGDTSHSWNVHLCGSTSNYQSDMCKVAVELDKLNGSKLFQAALKISEMRKERAEVVEILEELKHCSDWDDKLNALITKLKETE